ncbi:MAG: hypothetical protein P8Y45_00115 [Exilibacterium sp.]
MATRGEFTVPVSCNWRKIDVSRAVSTATGAPYAEFACVPVADNSSANDGSDSSRVWSE